MLTVGSTMRWFATWAGSRADQIKRVTPYLAEKNFTGHHADHHAGLHCAARPFGSSLRAYRLLGPLCLRTGSERSAAALRRT